MFVLSAAALKWYAPEAAVRGRAVPVCAFMCVWQPSQQNIPRWLAQDALGVEVSVQSSLS